MLPWSCCWCCFLCPIHFLLSHTLLHYNMHIIVIRVRLDFIQVGEMSRRLRVTRTFDATAKLPPVLKTCLRWTCLCDLTGSNISPQFTCVCDEKVKWYIWSFSWSIVPPLRAEFFLLFFLSCKWPEAVRSPSPRIVALMIEEALIANLYGFKWK